MLLPALAACNGGGKGGAGTTEPIETQPPVVEYALPEADLNNDEYVFMTVWGKIWQFESYQSNLDILNVDLMKRNKAVEEKYNCVIKTEEAADLKNTLMAGTDEDGSLISNTIKTTFGLVEAKLLMDLNSPELEHLDLDQPWYSQTVQSDTEVAQKLYFVNGDMLFTDDNAMWVTLFNKALAEKYCPDVNLYNEVKNNTWTIDKMMELATLATTELVADDKMTYEDKWGIIGEAPNVAALVTAAGHRYAEITPDGGIQLNVFSKDFQNVFVKCAQTVDQRFSLLATDIGGSDYHSVMDATFYEGRGLFMITSMHRALNFREMQTDFGILPLPKYNDAQSQYYTWTTYNTNVVSVPFYCEDPVRTSAIMEALFEESSYHLKSAYIDKALKYQTTRDDESVEMIDIIHQTTVYDIGVVYDFGSTYSKLNSLVVSRNFGAVNSQLAKVEENAYKAVDDLLINFGYKAG
jgi:hypothetical protein